MAQIHTTDEHHGEDGSVGITDRTPLLGKNVVKSSSSSPRPAPSHSRHSSASSITSLVTRSTRVLQAHRPSTIVNLLCALVVIVSSSAGFTTIPSTRIYEDILCRRYYEKLHSNEARQQPIDEELCKVDAIQSELAFLFAVLESLYAVVSVFAALPWGIIADRVGRKPLWTVSLIGMAFAQVWIITVAWFHNRMPIWCVWLAPLAYLCGAGNSGVIASLNSIVADTAPESYRSISFMRVHAASMLGNLVSPALASAMMSSTGPWPPMIVGIGLLTIPAFLIFAIPETLQADHKSTNVASTQPTGFRDSVARNLADLKDTVSIFKSRSLILLFTIGFFHLPLIMSTLQFLTQFTSKRYHIPLARTGYVQSAYGVATIVVTVVVVPWLSTAVMRGRVLLVHINDEKHRDLLLMKYSSVAAFTGAVILGASPALSGFILGLVVMSLGSALPGFLRSIETLYVGPKQRTRMFTVLGLVDIASNFWSGPALAGLFTLGMRLGGAWIGLPYFGISFISIVIFVLAIFVRLPTATTPEDGQPSLGDGLDEHECIS